jgi:hypothetical protein
VRVGCGYQSGAGVGARREGSSCGRAILDAVHEKEMVASGAMRGCVTCRVGIFR